MSNTLSFVSIYKSITGVPEITLPNFVVLTGRNGSGKSHLLQAIKAGHVKSSLAANVASDVQMFDWNTILPKDTGIFDPAKDQTRRSRWFNAIRKQREKQFPTLQQIAITLGIPSENCSTIRKLSSLTRAELAELLPAASEAEHVHAQLQQHIKRAGTNIYGQTAKYAGDEYSKRAASKAARSIPELFLTASESKLFEQEDLLWGEVDPFQQAFGRVFATYRDLIHSNDRLEKYPPLDDPERPHLPQNEFELEHGPPPWDFVNQILAECHLDFRVDHPPLHETASYEPRLEKQSKNVEMRFADLSSGEKVLMSFALCLYNSQENRQTKFFPKVLLLDEVDAPLHPSMTLSLLNTIRNVLVRDKGVAVILTTHSPSTVAIAPDDSIYCMNSEGPKIEKVSQGHALSILTTGVPTLSISFDGRRQVFVESRTDANLYDMLYQKYKDHMESERSLVFVEVGNTDKSGGEKNAGCEQVIRIVRALAEGGNQSVLGLVDWDGNREPTKRIAVLSAGLRDGLESLLFDPVLMVATIAHDNLAFAQQCSVLKRDESYTSLLGWDQNRWQTAVETLQNLVLGPSESKRVCLQVKYLSGLTIQVAKEYLHLDDHQLESRIVKAFGFLTPKTQKAGGLMRHVVLTILPDYPELMPNDILDTFTTLLTTNLQSP